MNRFHWLVLCLSLAFGGLSLAPAQAQSSSVEQSVTRQLRDQGFYNIQINRTFLGRLRFTSESETLTREVVVNPATGAVLRDFWRPKSGGLGGFRLGTPNGSSPQERMSDDSGGGGAGASGGSDRDDDDHDDDDGGRDDDDRDDDDDDDDDGDDD